MPTDIVFPEKNESEFVDMAVRLGYTKLIFVYDYTPNMGSILKKIKRITKIEVEIGLLAEEKHIRKAKKLVNFVLVSQAKRGAFENKDITVCNLERISRRDFMHHRGSGLDSVLCKLAQKNNITITFSLYSMLKGTEKIIGRIKQNIKLCRKYKIKTVIASFASDPYEMRGYKDLESLFSIISIK